MIFWKYHGLGNDFILVEDFGLSASSDPEVVRRLCDRRRGVGSDGIIYLEPDVRAVAFMKIMNSDGSEAEMCGNGIRCAAKHLYDFGVTDSKEMRINTLAGMKKVSCHVKDDEVEGVSVEMGAPELDCDKIPVNCHGQFIDQTLEVDSVKIKGTAVSMGNPHFVTFENLNDEKSRDLGPKIESHPFFPKRTNVEFVRKTEHGLDVKVYERGAGWTMACGTGACAVTVASVLKKLTPAGEETAVHLPGGSLSIKVAKDLSSVRMTGPAVRVFEGNIDW